MKTLAFALLVCISLTTACAPTQPAQSPPMSPPRTLGATGSAEVLFDEGLKLLDAGKLEEACKSFLQSEALEHTAATLSNVAECHVNVGRVASAWEAFTRVAAERR